MKSLFILVSDKLAEIFGFDRQKVWWYRDIALAIFAAIAALWAIVALVVGQSNFDNALGVGCILVAITCCSISPNRLMLFGSVLGVIAVQGWFSILFSRDSRSWWIAIPATGMAVAFFTMFGQRPIRNR